MAYGDPTGVNKILVEKYGYEWVNGKAWRPGTAPEPEIIPEEEPVAATPPEPSQPAGTPIEEPSPSEPGSLEERIEQLQASLNELQKKYEEALEKLEQANARIAELEGQQSEASTDVSDADDTAVVPEENPTPEPQQPAEVDEAEAVTPETPEVTAPEPEPTPQPSYPEPTGVNKILVEKYGYEWVNGKAWKPGTAPEPVSENVDETATVSETTSIPSPTLKPEPTLILQALAHEVSGTTHLSSLSHLVTAPYEGYPTFINGDFDFTNLEIDYSKLEFSSKAGPMYDQTDGYTGMVYYGNFGDVTGDGKPDMVISGWTVDTGNASGRIFLLELDPQNGITNIEWTDNEGTAAPWVEDFDGDGIAEIMSIGFYDFPVAPAPTIYFDGGLDKGASIGPDIDSHESSVVDYDGDGDLDVVAISYYNVNGLISLFRNNGNGFDHEYLPTDQSSYFASGSSIEYADLDGDGLGEFIVGDFAGDGGIAILKLNEDGTFLNSPEWKNVLEIRPYFESPDFDGINSIFTSDNPNASDEEIAKARSHDIVLKAIDVDGDGDLDILNSTALWHDNQSMGVLQVLINDGSGNFTDETDERLWNYSLTAEASHDLVFIDINNDGFLDIFTPEGGGNAIYGASGAGVDKANFNEGNTILLNDGTGHFLMIMFAPFSQAGTFKTDGFFFPNKWYPIIHSDGSLGYVNLEHGWTDYPNGEYDLFNYAHFDQILYTGPKFVNPSDYGAPGFNEFYVLRTNPDVQELVKTGVYGSALEWYLETNPSDLETFAKHAKVVGSEIDDVIHLREGNEIAIAGNGNDTIYVYDGNDTVTTGNGKDVIVVSGTSGIQNQNSITDFSLIGGDKLDLSAFSVISEAQTLELTTQIAAGALITLTENASVILEGVQIAELATAESWII